MDFKNQVIIVSGGSSGIGAQIALDVARKGATVCIFGSNKNKIKVNKLIHLVQEKGGIEFAEKKMNFYRQNAIKILHEFPKNDYRDSLELMLNYVIERNV